MAKRAKSLGSPLAGRFFSEGGRTSTEGEPRAFEAIHSRAVVQTHEPDNYGSWNALSAFDDYAELELRCDGITELAQAIQRHPRENWAPHLDLIRALRRELNRQHDQMAEAIERERPGGWQRVYISGRMFRLDEVLASIERTPSDLPDAVAYIVVELHAVLIWAHEVFDAKSRAALLASAYRSSIKRHNALIAKKPRNRKSDPGSAASFVKQVRAESKKRAWNTAWMWVCTQYENRQEIEGFDICEATDEAVTYTHSGTPKKRRSIKKGTFRDSWNGAHSARKSDA